MRPFLIAFAAVCVVSAPALATGQRVGRLEIEHPWSRPAPAGGNGAGYLTIRNHGPAADALVGVQTPVAARAEMHQMSMAASVMSMRRLARTPLPATRTTAFAPGGLHLMLIGLKRPLKAGDSFPATLAFASGGRITVNFTVADRPPATGAMHGHMGH